MPLWNVLLWLNMPDQGGLLRNGTEAFTSGTKNTCASQQARGSPRVLCLLARPPGRDAGRADTPLAGGMGIVFLPSHPSFLHVFEPVSSPAPALGRYSVQHPVIKRAEV